MHKVKDYFALKEIVVNKIKECHDEETLLKVLIESSHNTNDFLNNGVVEI
jgi:hypothetical protein